MAGVFPVDQETGTDRERLGKAHAKALAAIPATVLLPDRELDLSAYLNVRPGVSIQGEGPASGLFLNYPGAPVPAGNSPYGLGVLGPLGQAGTTLSGFTIRAREDGYYRLIRCQDTAGVALEALTFGVCGQNMVEIRGCTNVQIGDCTGRYGGDNSYDGASAKYKISVINSTDVHLARLDMGRPEDDHNQSFVTFNNVLRGSVTDSVFHQTRTYSVNTHGTGSSQIVFERNQLSHNARLPLAYAAVLLGNEAWGADRDITIRNNTMNGPGRFLEIRASSSHVFAYNNPAPDCTEYVRIVEGGGAVMVAP